MEAGPWVCSSDGARILSARSDSIPVGNDGARDTVKAIASLLGEHLLLKQELTSAQAQTIQRLDIVYGVSAAIVLITYRFVAPQVKILSPCPEQQDRCTISGVLEVKKEIPDDTPAQLVLFQRGLCRTARQ